jgi:hypothetical protein
MHSAPQQTADLSNKGKNLMGAYNFEDRDW